MATTDDDTSGESGAAGPAAGGAASTAEAQVAQAARRTYAQAGRTLRVSAERGEDILVTAAREHPVSTVLAALAVGFLFGRAL
jgi:hypothetical protein